MLKTIKPQILDKGDAICLVSPSSGMASLVPHRVNKAVETLKNMGFKVKISPRALNKLNYTSGTPMERAKDINDAFADKSIKAIISMIGGDHSNQILRYIDFNIISKNPKIFVGFSDITVLHLALYQMNHLVTFYGPAAITQFGEYPNILDYTKKYFLKALTTIKPVGTIVASDKWTDELLDWTTKEDLKRPRKMQKSSGNKWLKQGETEGIILGGCIPSINHLLGTKYWPDFQNKILFIDIPEGYEIGKGFPVSELDSFLADLDNIGLFGMISGLIIGRAYGYSDDDAKKLIQIITNYTNKYHYPILFNVNIGHTDPIITLPLGVKIKMNSQNNLFGIQESGVTR